MILFLSCLSIEEKLVSENKYPPRRSAEEVIVIRAPLEGVVYLGELSILADEGYEKGYILHILKKRASKLGADVIHVARKKKIDSSWRVNQEPGSYYSVNTRKIRITVKMYRYRE